MGATLRHRGPDGDGLWSDAQAGVALSHRRLAVIDLSEHGHQPMVSRDGRYVLAFNGEIYNYPEMAAALAANGAVLRGHSDTEVLLETIAQSSVRSALQQANGMFALAVWDRRTRTLTLARDRLGEKPLYYTDLGGQLAFASELGALQRHPRFSAGIDRGALALMARHSYVPGPHTIFEGVRKLPPGHTLTHRPGDRDTTAEPYWSLAHVAASGRSQAGSVSASDEPIVDRAEELLTDAVRGRMVSDVPLGAFLSGGIDSSLVVALMQSAGAGTARTFTVSVGGAYDESEHAAKVAAHLGTDHTHIELAESEALALASAAPGMYDEPFADPSAIPTALVCRAAREHVTVCLTGDAGDELLAGYNRYLAADASLRRLMLLPSPLRRALANTIQRVPPHRWDTAAHRLPGSTHLPDVGTKAHKLADLLRSSDGFAAYRSLTTVLEPSQLLPGVGESATVATESARWPAGLDPLHLMLYVDQLMTLPDDMLVKVDRASMAVSLECRVPLLDHRFVEYTWTLPTRVKVRDRRGKWLLRQVLDRHVPLELVDRPKQGFDPPIAAWLRGPLREWMCDLLAPSRLRAQGLFDVPAVTRLVQEHLTGARNHDYGLWTLITFQSWLADRGGVGAQR